MESLSYQVPAQSSAITQRKQQVRFYPTSASSLSPTGVRTVRIRLGGNDFLDPNIRVVYTLQNADAAHALCPVCGPWGPFAQVRLLSGGIELDNIPSFHRHMELHAWRLSTIEQQQNEALVDRHLQVFHSLRKQRRHVSKRGMPRESTQQRVREE
jgi:hypothetical protein